MKGFKISFNSISDIFFQNEKKNNNKNKTIDLNKIILGFCKIINS